MLLKIMSFSLKENTFDGHPSRGSKGELTVFPNTVPSWFCRVGPLGEGRVGGGKRGRVGRVSQWVQITQL